jgi:hypothetical protein
VTQSEEKLVPRTWYPIRPDRIIARIAARLIQAGCSQPDRGSKQLSTRTNQRTALANLLGAPPADPEIRNKTVEAESSWIEEAGIDRTAC